MARDIEEFLRKAAERRAAQQKGQQPGTAKPPARPMAPASGNSRSARSVPAEDVIDLAGEPEPFPSGRTVAEHVRQHIDSGAAEISQHTRQLGREVAEKGQKARQRIQQNLDHEVGQLGSGQAAGKGKSRQQQQAGTSQQAAKPKPVLNLPPERQTPVINSVGLGQILRSPASIRQAIIVSELLKRPEWD